MLSSVYARGGIVTAPHYLAAEAGREVLRGGGNAVEAMIAMAAVIPVVYPHMNAIGGDSFWLVKPAGKQPIGIDASGAAAKNIGREIYLNNGYEKIPARGPLAANTVAGTVSGWNAALQLSRELGGCKPCEYLLDSAIYYAEKGFPISKNQSIATEEKKDEFLDIPGYGEAFMVDGKLPKTGDIFKQPRLATTLRRLAVDGFETFYRGPLAEKIVKDLAYAGSPLSADDLESHRAICLKPLSVQLKTGKVWNMPPPTQGLASLMTLGLFDRLGVSDAESFAHIHGLVESVKQAFIVRNSYVQDPSIMTVNAHDFLTDVDLDRRVRKIDNRQAMVWPAPSKEGDTVWLGAVDSEGNAVSFIQSIYWEFGSGVVLEDTGILWQNRGASFSLHEHDVNTFAPGRKPFHTLNPAMAEYSEGGILCYGTMGGEGQPQTQSLIYSRHVNFGQSIQEAITAPRFLLGRTWGDMETTLKVESRFDFELVTKLKEAGHDVDLVDPFSDLMGHAGAVSLRPDGLMEGGADPRADGKAVGI